MTKLRVKIYNVRFGDAILVIVPDRNAEGVTHTRHILIDFGNVLSGEGGSDTVFEPVIDNIIQTLDGNPLDLYIMTHEHMDHTQGLLYAAEKLNKKLGVKYAWLTASAAEDYYEKHPEAKKKKLEAIDVYKAIERFLKTAPAKENTWIKTLMWINNPRKTADCVQYLRKLAEKENTTYVYRGCQLDGRHPFQETHFQIWAPEEDTSVYYGKFKPMALNTKPTGTSGTKFTHEYPEPPAGVDAGAFYNLVEMRSRGYMDNILAIDKATNNTSVVFCLQWRGWKLLFAGDAEHRSWKTMNKFNVLEPVHFFKVSHHGSHTGLPSSELLDKILPVQHTENDHRIAVVPTYLNTYKDVPDKELLEKELSPLCELKFVEKETVADGEYLDFEFEG
jgi:hypothetical protein